MQTIFFKKSGKFLEKVDFATISSISGRLVVRVFSDSKDDICKIISMFDDKNNTNQIFLLSEDKNIISKFLGYTKKYASVPNFADNYITIFMDKEVA